MYTSSIIKKYNDTENVARDSKVLFDIIDRQGYPFIIDCFAEYCGKSANKFKYDFEGRSRLIDGLRKDLTNALLERL